ncbi:hypothetical protein CVT24_009918 [Panaeolus cyanescens]|uniref:Uncharacterized protein n=1 Tax=Panaeolus cyanescens TaxID=181874 RepID=A0A409WU41_9AGAR|nr:hypothetical protein CVT24_009918 [Panaeolus cyanescens]
MNHLRSKYPKAEENLGLALYFHLKLSLSIVAPMASTLRNRNVHESSNQGQQELIDSPISALVPSPATRGYETVDIKIWRVTQTIHRFAQLAEDKSVVRIRTDKLMRLCGRMQDAGRVIDKSYRLALQSFMACQYLAQFPQASVIVWNYATERLPSDHADVVALQQFILCWAYEIREVHVSLYELRRNVVQIFGLRKGGTENGDPNARIMQYVSGPSPMFVSQRNHDNLLKKIDDALLDVEQFCADIRDLSRWWSHIHRYFEFQVDSDVSRNFLDSFTGNVPKIQQRTAFYLTNMRQTVVVHANSSFTYPRSARTIEEARYCLWSAQSPRDTSIFPEFSWATFLQTTSLVLIAGAIPIAVEGEVIDVNWITARITNIVDIGGNQYGIIIRIRTADNAHQNAIDIAKSGEDGKDGTPTTKTDISQAGFRLRSMTTELTFIQGESTRAKPVIQRFSPSARRPLLAKGIEITSKSSDNGVIWTFRPQHSLDHRFLDCDLGVVLKPTPSYAMSSMDGVFSAKLSINIKYDTFWKGKVRLSGFFKWTTCYTSKAFFNGDGLTAIPVPAYRQLGLIESGEEQTLFETCGIVFED